MLIKKTILMMKRLRSGGMVNMGKRCRHYRVKIDVREGRCGHGYNGTAECADCGFEFDVVEINGYEVE